MHRTKLMAGVLLLALATVPRPAAADAAPMCEPAGDVTATVELVPPAGIGLAGVKVRLDYPEQRVAVRGHGDDAEVKARVAVLPGGVLAQANDEDDALIVALVSTSPIPRGPVATITFDVCRGAAPASAADLACVVEQASDEQGTLVSGATCRVTLHQRREGVAS